MLQGVLWVGAGGMIGTITRYLLSLWIDSRLGSTFPYATLTINLSGSFLLGVLAGGIEFGGLPAGLRLGLGVGFLGGFTTFSTFTYETVRLVEAGSLGFAFAYVALSAVVGIGAAILGLALGRSF